MMRYVKKMAFINKIDDMTTLGGEDIVGGHLGVLAGIFKGKKLAVILKILH